MEKNNHLCNETENPWEMPIPDPEKYLARLGLLPENYDRRMHRSLPASPTDYAAPQTKASLDALVTAHLMAIPFENLDLYELHREVSLKIEDLFEKIVIQRRGGYCFELNGLFFALLKSLGFDCYPIAERVLPMAPFPPLSHRASLVILPTGEKVVCDVGYGGPGPVTALYLQEDTIQTSGKRSYRYERTGEGTYRLWLIMPEGEKALFDLEDHPFAPVDFLPLNAYMVHNADSRFRNNRVMNRLTPKGSAAMDNDILRLHEDGVLTERMLKTPEERKRAYVEYFGMGEEGLKAF